jgi:Tfp pilus assembly protein PilV
MAQVRHNTGFAMVDALVALLLFALVLLAAIAALLQGMRATHAAALTGHAVDLAADLLEQRRALPAGVAADAVLAAWNDRLRQELPAAARPTAQALVQPLLAVDAGGTP